jgi:hypothetical protein
MGPFMQATSFRFRILLVLLLSLAVGGQFFAYELPSLTSRVFLLICYLVLLFVTLITCSNRIRASPTAQIVTVFAVSLVVSLAFVLQRYHLLTPSFMQEVVHSEYFLAAQSFVQSGALTSGLQHSFLFQEPMILSSLMSTAGISIDTVAYISLVVDAVVIAFAATLLFRAAIDAFGDKKGIASSLMPGITVFSLISFAYSQRTEIGISLMLLLLSLLFAGGFSRRRVVNVLLLVIGITFGSTTSMFVIVPFFFLFALLNQRKSSLIYGMIPLSYLFFVGYSYLLSIRSYTTTSFTGLISFIQEIATGKLPQRVLPWQRSQLPSVGDTYVTSLAYISLLAVSGLILLIGLTAWRKKRISVKNYQKTLYQAALIAGLLLFAFAIVAYIGASVEPESTSSDIRTIAIVLVTLLLPFLLVSKEISATISAKWFLSIFVIGLLIFASFRTFYEPYPKSVHDPVNVVEDDRVDSFSISNVGNFLSKFSTSGSIVFDFKTSRIADSIVNGTSRSSLLTLTVGPASLVVFDSNGLKLGSLYTSPEAYMEANNLTSSQNLIYNDGSVLIVKQK